VIVHELDPLRDPRWPRFLDRQAAASIFHGRGWLTALRRSYGFEPVVLTTTPAGRELDDGIALCRVNSRLTGRRLVSLPFSDHCQPLCQDAGAAAALAAGLTAMVDGGGWRRCELRPLEPVPFPASLAPGETFRFHALDLTPDEDALWSGLHKTAVRQMIGRGEREDLQVSAGRDARHIDLFYELLLKTRRKHRLPPQPRSWFRNLAACLGDAVGFRVALKDERPVAAIVTTRYRDVVTHKYGCSDAAFSGLGGTQLLLWRAMLEGRAEGARVFDMGRSDPENEGLVRFKRRWGAAEREIVYLGYPAAEPGGGRLTGLAGAVFARLPDPLLEAAGRLLYRHVG